MHKRIEQKYWKVLRYIWFSSLDLLALGHTFYEQAVFNIGFSYISSKDDFFVGIEGFGNIFNSHQLVFGNDGDLSMANIYCL